MWRFKVALHLSFGFPWQFSSTHLNPRVERGVIKANITSTNTTQRPIQGLPWSYPSGVHWAKCLVIWHQIVPTSELYLCCRCFYIISQLACNHGETFVKQTIFSIFFLVVWFFMTANHVGHFTTSEELRNLLKYPQI